MRERPILMSGPMVRAILAGTKTQTRRPVKLNASGRAQLGGRNWHLGDPYCVEACPFGQPGDRLWVRETWRVGAWLHPQHDRTCMHHVAVDYAADGFCRREWLECGCSDKLAAQSIEDAENAGLYEDEHGEFKWEVGHSPCRWRPSIHMPRWACRLVLEIVSVRVERVQDIGPCGAAAEGFDTLPEPRADYLDTRRANFAMRGFHRAWDGLYAAKGQGWDANPWVWVVEFKRVEASA